MKRALALFFILLFIFLGTYGGQLHSIDEWGFANMALGFVRDGTPHVDGLWWTGSTNFDDVMTPLKMPGIYRNDHLYYIFEAGQALMVIPLVWLGTLMPPTIGVFQTLLLFNPIVVAALGALFYLLLRRLGTSSLAALLAALILCLATPLWPYAHQFFREPMGAFFLLLTLACLVELRLRRRSYWALLAGIALGIAQTARTTHILVLPAAAIYLVLAADPCLLVQMEYQRRISLRLLSKLRDRTYLRTLLKWGLLFALGLTSILLVTLWYNFNMYGAPIHSYFSFNWFENSIPLALYGLLLSAGKGLVVYAPPVLLALWAGPAWSRHSPHEAIFCLLAFVPSVLLLSSFYQWWGGICWGPRYLVPFIPLILLPLGFALQTLWKCHLPGRLAIVLLVGAGIAFQIPAVLADYSLYISALKTQLGDPPETGYLMFNYLAAPVLAQWSYLQPEYSDVIWWYPGGLDLRLPLLALTGVVAVALLLFLLGNKTSWRQRMAAGLLAVGGTGFAIMLAALALMGTARFQNIDLLNAATRVNQVASPNDTLISLMDSQTIDLLTIYHPGPHLYGMSEESPSAQTRQVLNRALRDDASIWVLSKGLTSTSRTNQLEAWLAGQAYRGDEYWWGDVRLVRYLPARSTTRMLFTSEATFTNGVQLADLSIEANEMKQGDWVRVKSTWNLTQPVQEHLVVFMHLVDYMGRSWAGRDDELAGGYRSFSTVQTGQPVSDLRAFQLPADLPPGQYRFEVGLTNGSGGVRVPLSGDSADSILIGMVIVRPRIPEVPVVPDIYATIHELPLRWQYGPQLVSYRIEKNTITLSWRSDKQLSSDLTMFVQILDASNRIVAQSDRRPHDGRYPTTLWRPGEIVNDTTALSLPENLPTGKYTIIAGWYTQPSLQRLFVLDAQGTPTGDAAVLETLEQGR